MEYLYIYWLVLFVVFVVFEIITLGLTTIWFAGGALISFVLSLFQVDLWIQITVFLVVSVLLLLITRPYAKKFINKGVVKTNVDEMTGKIGKVTEEINNNGFTGHVNINGMDWTARSEDSNKLISKDKLVVVQRVEGVKLIVKEKTEEN